MLAALLASLSACGTGRATGDQPPCEGKRAPSAPTATRLQLSRVDMGERDRAGQSSPTGWRSLGYDLDGTCTTLTEAITCKRPVNTSASYQVDGDRGIDNSFGKTIMPLFLALYEKPSTTWSGRSYLDVDGAGNGMLYLVDTGNRVVRFPLRGARIEWTGNGNGMLGATIPSAAFETMLRHDLGAVSKELCAGLTIDSLLDTVHQSSDMPAVGATDPERDCDGISIGMTFEGTPTGSLPAEPVSLCNGN